MVLQLYLWYVCTTIPVICLYNYTCDMFVQLYLWYVCTTIPVIRLYNCTCDMFVQLYLWYVCTTIPGIRLYNYTCDMSVQMYLWYVYTTVHIYLFNCSHISVQLYPYICTTVQCTCDMSVQLSASPSGPSSHSQTAVSERAGQPRRGVGSRGRICNQSESTVQDLDKSELRWELLLISDLWIWDSNSNLRLYSLQTIENLQSWLWILASWPLLVKHNAALWLVGV